MKNSTGIKLFVAGWIVATIFLIVRVVNLEITVGWMNAYIKKDMKVTSADLSRLRIRVYEYKSSQRELWKLARGRVRRDSIKIDSLTKEITRLKHDRVAER